jgi:hypothetical protein
MNLDNLAFYLQLDTYELFGRLKRMEHCMSVFLIVSQSDQAGMDTRLDARDIRSITAIAKNCSNNPKLMNEDCLLEIIFLYYYIMDIFHEDYNTETLENYFCIRNFTNILLANIGSFSTPYVESNLRRKI